jgi:hypothetical protein
MPKRSLDGGSGNRFVEIPRALFARSRIDRAFWAADALAGIRAN